MEQENHIEPEFDFDKKFIKGSLFDNQYRIIQVNSQGGMATILHVRSEHDNRYYAIKIPFQTPDEQRSALTFEREARALSDLSHANIAKLIDSCLSDRLPYLVIEWLPNGDLAKKIRSLGGCNWGDFYENIGRPLISALAYAHQRNWVHRDLKPQNILFDQNDTPKIIDFGISRDTRLPQIGLTFHQTGSPPYTPPEIDDGYQSHLRDIYSWGAIAVSCLTGKIYHTEQELRYGLDGLKEINAPKAILRKALSSQSTDRHESASILLADLDIYHNAALQKATPPLPIYLDIKPTALRRLNEQHTGLTENDSRQYICSDINSIWAASLEKSTGTAILVGATIRAACKFSDYTLAVDNITIHSPDKAHEFRENFYTVAGAEFFFCHPSNYAAARSALQTLANRLEIAENVQAAEAEKRRKQYWFDVWAEFLREKERLYKQRQLRFAARSMEDFGDYFVAAISGDIDSEQVGPSLVLHSESGRPLIFTTVNVEADKVKMILRSGRKHDIPKSNITFLTNFEAERKSIQRQRAALEDIRSGRAVSPTIGDLLSEPGIAPPPEPAGMVFPDHLSEDKRQVLDKAMEIRGVMVVNGPPGTGKTTLIAELISSYLTRYPSRRILLSSQTHVALDHIIVKLDEKGISDDVVRIVPADAENASKVNKSVAPLTLEQKTRTWCIKAESRSEEFMERFAERKGVSAYDIKIRILGYGFIETRKRLAMLQDNLKLVAIEKQKLEGKSPALTDDVVAVDIHEVLRKTEATLTIESRLREEVSALEARLNRLQASLDRLDGFGTIFDSTSDDEILTLLEDIGSTISSDSELLNVMKLHFDWLARLGSERSFHGAVLREARIVAGTCIGLASTPAFQQDEYDLCIVDEASKATASETLVPMSRSKRTILVGDPKQLPPFIESVKNDTGESNFSDDAKKSLLSVLLERLPETCVEELVEQRRMCSSIGSMISQVFYNDKLINVRSDDERHEIVSKIYPKAVNWISTSNRKDRRETEASGNTYQNKCETGIVIDQLKEIARHSRRIKQGLEIAVIAAYSAQVANLRDAISQQIGINSGFKIEVNTVDSFQGREADICIYSITRSNNEGRIGFQRQVERLNVALSRARDALVIIGDMQFCQKVKKQNSFHLVIDYIAQNPDFCRLIEL